MGMDMMDRDSKPVSHKNIGMSLELSLWSKKNNVSLQKPNVATCRGRALPADSAPARGSWRFFAGTAPGTTFPAAWLNHPCWWYNNRNENDEDKITMLGTISTKIGTIVTVVRLIIIITITIIIIITITITIIIITIIIIIPSCPPPGSTPWHQLSSQAK